MRLIEHPSPNFDERGRPIDLLILHYTGMQDGEIAIDRLCDPEPRAGVYAFPWETPEDPSAALNRVSAHYVVDEEGRVLRLVAEDKRAWHAGAGQWNGESDLNARSIGVEIVNGGHDFGLPDFPGAQIEAVIELVEDICLRNGLKPHQVVGHSDVAPTRKADPGEKFPWARLAAKGLALYPQLKWKAETGAAPIALGAQGAKVSILQRMLAEIGYGIDDTGEFDEHTEAVVKAFQRRFRATRIDGAADIETQAIVTDILMQTRKLARVRADRA